MAPSERNCILQVFPYRSSSQSSKPTPCELDTFICISQAPRVAAGVAQGWSDAKQIPRGTILSKPSRCRQLHKRKRLPAYWQRGALGVTQRNLTLTAIVDQVQHRKARSPISSESLCRAWGLYKVHHIGARPCAVALTPRHGLRGRLLCCDSQAQSRKSSNAKVSHCYKYVALCAVEYTFCLGMADSRDVLTLPMQGAPFRLPHSFVGKVLFSVTA